MMSDIFCPACMKKTLKLRSDNLFRHIYTCETCNRDYVYLLRNGNVYDAIDNIIKFMTEKEKDDSNTDQ